MLFSIIELNSSYKRKFINRFKTFRESYNFIFTNKIFQEQDQLLQEIKKYKISSKKRQTEITMLKS